MNKKLIIGITIGGIIIVTSATSYALTGQNLFDILNKKLSIMVDNIIDKNQNDRIIDQQKDDLKKQMNVYMDKYLNDINNQLTIYNQQKRDDIKKAMQNAYDKQVKEIEDNKQKLIDNGKTQIDATNNTDLVQTLKDLTVVLDDSIIKDQNKK